ncbi:mitochondrial ribonuclease P protein 1 homolog isoform X1 [Diorhabda sublineata]|uniref:mitochondrial ribonuclease P protein 1 homolog isoform X1 n=2 Tax=Diorhabda sublineata TaxID=1163346 RepID=UPI0024E04824|nr:mitochondrial ribonuclease P protein 1 homolog isoform X1 [Diorhabda sublineata]
MFLINIRFNTIFRKINESTCLALSRNFNKRSCSQFNQKTEVNYDDITNGNKEAEHKLKVLMLEAEVMRQEGKAVPDHDFLKAAHWKEVLSLPSRSSRQKYLEHLFKVSKKKENIKAKKEEKRIAYENFLNEKQQQPKAEETLEEFALKYDLQHNNMFLRFYETTMNQMYNNRLIQALQFGQKLVVDCGYDINMTRRENINCAKQLMLLFAENRMHDDPFDVHYCNANKESTLIKAFHKYIPTMYEPWFPLNIHECSYLDMYPKNQLVYLTPHCREEVQEFDHDAIYIIGAIVDKMNQEPLSLAKAKREGLKMAKLPLDRYLHWGAGSGKSLTLNQMIAILLDQKLSENWEFSLRHVPRRKLMETGGSGVSNRNKEIKKWTPSHKVDFDKLGYNRMKKNVNIHNIFNE